MYMCERDLCIKYMHADKQMYVLTCTQCLYIINVTFKFYKHVWTLGYVWNVPKRAIYVCVHIPKYFIIQG